MSERSVFGQIELFSGPMCSGKSSTLISRYRRTLSNSFRKPFIIAPLSCRDAKLQRIAPRQGEPVTAEFVEQLDNSLLERIFDEQRDSVFIDEAQFFQQLGEDEVFNFCDNLINKGVHVFVAALDMDYQRHPWKGIARLHGLAPKITHLQAWCTFCGKDAVYTLRISESTKLIDIEASYEPTCRRCYLDRTTKE
jgi:thymidine kinase